MLVGHVERWSSSESSKQLSFIKTIVTYRITPRDILYQPSRGSIRLSDITGSTLIDLLGVVCFDYKSRSSRVGTMETPNST